MLEFLYIKELLGNKFGNKKKKEVIVWIILPKEVLSSG